MEKEGLTFAKALRIAKEVFAYTNHTIMAEALEKWNVSLVEEVIPQVYKYIVELNDELIKELNLFGVVSSEEQKKYLIIDDDTIHMARIAIFVSHSTNGVARLHTEILKK